jgi:hypothetical protein
VFSSNGHCRPEVPNYKRETMSIGSDEIRLTLDKQTVILRPSLRASMRLERKYGFAQLVTALASGSVSALCDVIAECSTTPTSIPQVLRSLDKHPLKRGIEALSVPVLNLVLMMAGVTDDAPAKGEATGEAMPWAEYHERLFALGTGWLLWSPSDTWNATPAEIIAAYKARCEMIGAVFGGKTEDDPQSPLKQSESEIAQGRATLRRMSVFGENRSPR